MSTDTVVEVDSLRHRYGVVIALDGISFRVHAASILGILGPNGCGKTTLFRVLTTLLTPDSGRATISGADVVTQRNRVLAAIGVVFQKPSLDGKLTVLENVLFHGQLYGLSGLSLKRRASELLERFGVEDRASHRVDTLSGGLQRRVELAKCLIHQPRVLIMDEPSTGLDPAARTVLLDYLQALRDRDGVTSLLTTHLMDEAERCDQTAIMDLGRIVALDTPSALRSTIGGDVVTIDVARPEHLIGRIHERFGRDAILDDRSIRVERERGHEFVPQLIEAFPGEIDGVSVSKPTLGDVFLHLTGRTLGAEGEGRKRDE